MKETIFTGAAVALVTPFNPDMSVNYEELEKLIEFQITSGTDAIVTCGTTGEAATLSDEEHVKVIEFTVNKVAGRVPVIAGTGSNDTAYAVELSQKAEALGANGLLLVTPYYNKTSQRGLVASFNRIAGSVKIPCIVYNVPSRTGLNILPETYYELSKTQNIVATKEANHNISALIKTRELCGDDLTVYSGEDTQTLPIASLGGKGVISTFSNIMPKEMHELAIASVAGDLKTAQALTFKYLDLMNALFMDVNPIPVKQALNLMGFNCGHCRLPLADMSDEQIATLKVEMAKHLQLA